MNKERKEIKNIAITLALIGLTMAGCQSHYWYQEGKTFEECRRDCFECNYEAGKYARGVGVTFHEYPYSWGLPSGGPTSLHYGTGGRSRAGLRYDCMQAKGYRLVPKEQLPLEMRQGQNLGQIAD